jgi:hypothetical protein
MRRWLVHGARAAACAAALLLGGCSEKAPGTIVVWRFSEHLTTRRAALTSVVAPRVRPSSPPGSSAPRAR